MSTNGTERLSILPSGNILINQNTYETINVYDIVYTTFDSTPPYTSALATLQSQRGGEIQYLQSKPQKRIHRYKMVPPVTMHTPRQSHIGFNTKVSSTGDNIPKSPFLFSMTYTEYVGDSTSNSVKFDEIKAEHQWR